ncbi:MAG: guanylate kinase [Chloroflexi bacterium RBG_16_50_9]|nr:MAG: guanylate kinase [Chloroflexi bacterium RBG_16_50_9]
MSSESYPPLSPPAKPLLIVLSGFSGAGKDAILHKLRESGCPLEFIITVTTRAQRTNERDGVHYRFLSKNKFQELIDRRELLEWATVYGNWYGVPREPVKHALDTGKDIIIKVDVQGAAAIKKILPQAVFIFLTPPSMDDLLRRLKQRRTESPADLDLRVKTAREELEKLPLFDYIVLNRQGEIDRAAAAIQAIIAAEKCRAKPRELVL